MKLSANHIRRYQQIARLLWKYGRSDWVRQMNLAEHPEPAVDTPATPDRLADDLEEMGPTFVKLGQVLAGRPDFLPPPYIASLARLQDKVKPFPYAEVEQTVMTELGVRISKAFSYFETEPLAAASLGQVHRAALRDGREVVVKVQRPHIREQVAGDFEVLEEIARLLDAHTEFGRRYRFGTVLDEFRATIQLELNYEREAQNLLTLGKNLQEYKSIRIPQPVADYTTRSVLTMDYVPGQKISTLSAFARMGMNIGPIVEELFRAYLQQVLIDGFFHADPHPGNVFITDDGHIVLLDLGMVGRLVPNMRENLLKLLLAINSGDSDKAADIVMRISERTDESALEEFRRHLRQLVAQTQNAGLSQMKVGQTLINLSRSANQCGVIVPSELTLLGKTLLQLDEVGRLLDPSFDPNASIRRHASELMTRSMQQTPAQGSIFDSLQELKNFLGALPVRLNLLMESLTSSGVEVRVRAPDAKMVVEGLHKLANRITSGLILAALIIGASLLMRIPTHFQIFGYPGLAILCFLGAAGGGVWLILSIIFHDRKSLRKRTTH